jgi:regulatory protein
VGREPQTDAERLTQALDWAYAHVNRRERTVAEVRAHLERKGVAEATADAVLAELTETRLIDDERFAEMYVADKRELQSWGAERIRRGLHERGIDRELTERALAGAGAPGEDPPRPGAGAGTDVAERELERALALLRRRFPEPPRERRERDRALGVLIRKGYESELALDALAAHARGL